MILDENIMFVSNIRKLNLLRVLFLGHDTNEYRDTGIVPALLNCVLMSVAASSCSTQDEGQKCNTVRFSMFLPAILALQVGVLQYITS